MASSNLGYSLYHTQKQKYISSVFWQPDGNVSFNYGDASQAAQWHYQCAVLTWESLPVGYKNVINVVENSPQPVDGYATQCWKCQEAQKVKDGDK